MLLKRLINSAVQAALVQGVVIDLKTKDEVEDQVLFPEPKSVQLTQLETDKYKVPFFFVTGILIGAAFGLKSGKTVVYR